MSLGYQAMLPTPFSKDHSLSEECIDTPQMREYFPQASPDNRGVHVTASHYASRAVTAVTSRTRDFAARGERERSDFVRIRACLIRLRAAATRAAGNS